MPTRPRTRRRRVTRTALPVVVVVLGLSALRMHQVHEETGEWRLQPSDSPATVRFADRDYRRGDPVTGPPAGTREIGRVLDGAPVLARTPAAGQTSTVIYLTTDGGWLSYSLVGGP